MKFLDYDNDGWPDIFIANGHVDPQVEEQSFGVGYAERPLLFHNLSADESESKFEEVGSKGGPRAARRNMWAERRCTADFWNRRPSGLALHQPGRLAGSAPQRSCVRRPLASHQDYRSANRIAMDSVRGSKSQRRARPDMQKYALEAVLRVRAIRGVHFGFGAATKVDSDRRSLAERAGRSASARGQPIRKSLFRKDEASIERKLCWSKADCASSIALVRSLQSSGLESQDSLNLQFLEIKFACFSIL